MTFLNTVRKYQNIIVLLSIVAIAITVVVVYQSVPRGGKLTATRSKPLEAPDSVRARIVAQNMGFPSTPRNYKKGTPNDYLETNRRTDIEWVDNKVSNTKFDGTDGWPQNEMGWWGGDSIPPLYDAQPKIWPY